MTAPGRFPPAIPASRLKAESGHAGVGLCRSFLGNKDGDGVRGGVLDLQHVERGCVAILVKADMLAYRLPPVSLSVRYACAPVTASASAIILASSLSAALLTPSLPRPLIKLDGLLKTSRVFPSGCS